jgi:TonB family protein
LHPAAIPLSATPDFVERPSGTELGAAVIPSARQSSYDLWSLLLGTLALFAIIGVSFLIGYRVGWLHPTEPRVWSAQSLAAEKPPVETAVTPTSSVAQKTTAVPPKLAAKRESARFAKSVSPSPRPAANQDELVVYEKGKVIFRLKPGSTKPEDLQAEDVRNNQGKREFAKPIETADGNGGAVVQASSTARIPALNSQQDNSQKILLSPKEAQTRLLKRVDPEYPAEALASRRSGKVVLKVNVAENGAVASVHTVSGDPLLARAASTAVRNWRYEPYRQGDHAAKFQTDVTLSFTLPN